MALSTILAMPFVSNPPIALFEILCATTPADIPMILSTLHVSTDRPDRINETHRGLPGFPLTTADQGLIALQPLRVYSEGEVVAWKDKNRVYRYGVVVGTEPEGCRVTVQLGPLNSASMLSSDVFAFKRLSQTDQQIGSSDSSSRSTPTVHDAEDRAAQARSDTTGSSSGQRSDLVEAAAKLLASAGFPVAVETEVLMHELLDARKRLLKAELAVGEVRRQLDAQKDSTEALQRTVTCPVCYANMVDTLFECGHVLCQTCYAMLPNNKCPVCRMSITKTHRIFM